MRDGSSASASKKEWRDGEDSIAGVEKNATSLRPPFQDTTVRLIIVVRFRKSLREKLFIILFRVCRTREGKSHIACCLCSYV